MASKGQKFNKYSDDLKQEIMSKIKQGMSSWHAILKKETLYNNNITSLQEYIQLVEDWILFYNTTRLKSKVKKKRKIIFSF